MTHTAAAAPLPLDGQHSTPSRSITSLLDERSRANRAFFNAEAPRIAAVCAQMADRFLDGGRLIALGVSPAARSDASHVAVEFVHPVIVGKRALPAIAVCCEAGGAAARVALLASPRDMCIAFGSADADDASAVSAAIAMARGLGCLTLAFDRLGAEFEFIPPSEDAFVRQELGETLYHVLWELVHVYFEHRGQFQASERSHPGATAFLYPFLADAPRDLSSVERDVARSVLAKSSDIGELRERSLTTDGGALLSSVADLVRSRLDEGGTVLAFGNGGSATDAQDLVADLLTPPAGAGFRQRRAIDLAADSSIVTALTNDVGTDVVFSRQIIAYGHEHDIAIAFTTSGSSRNVLAALAEARRRGIATVAFTGYDGGRIAAEHLADRIVVVPSEYVPRIQEAHATAYHVIRTLVG